jgi:tetratricopeptide (TPR) repeat protein
MLDNLRGLGLPRRGGEGCLFCHVGDMDVPRDTWDWASDDKLEKRKARDMMAMVAAINNDHLGDLEERSAPDLQVGCVTCHAGRTDPRPLTDVLRSAYADDGIEGVMTRYRELRARYFAADAYDFRSTALAGLAGEIAGTGALDDAIELAGANVDVYPNDGTANGTLLLLELHRARAAGGIAAALSLFDEIAAGERAMWAGYSVLDSLGWTLFRRGNTDDALVVFRANLERFADQYIPNESLADALIQTDEQEAGVRLFEAWLEKHPDHETARRRLRALR